MEVTKSNAMSVWQFNYISMLSLTWSFKLIFKSINMNNLFRNTTPHRAMKDSDSVYKSCVLYSNYFYEIDGQHVALLNVGSYKIWGTLVY